MIAFNEYINESQKFKLTEDERSSVAQQLGFLLGYLGDKKDIEKFNNYKESLCTDDIELLNEIYDLLDDTTTYYTINNSILHKSERRYLNNLLKYMEDHDMIDYRDYDLISAYEKIADSCV